MLESIEKFREDYFSAKSIREKLLQNLEDTKKLKLLTSDKSVPSDEIVNQIFAQYGEVELTTINAEISNWFETLGWDKILEEESIAA